MHYRSTDLLCSSAIESFLCTILLSFLTEKPNSEGNSESSSGGYVDASLYSPLVQRVLSHVEKNPNEKYNLSSLALSLGFNKSYLCTVFRRETGITISDYINYNRIRKILIMLQYNGYNKNFPIHELAHQFGYPNPSYFNRVFKKYTGMTPIEFINALSKCSDDSNPSAFQKYYIEYLDMKRYSIQESLEYMRGLKDAAEISEFSDNDCKESKNNARL
jgi:AraC-like DNA-binding protein